MFGLRGDYHLPQNKFSACKSADDCKQFFVPFVAVSQGFTEISAANRESLNWTSGSMSRYDDIINIPHHVSPTRQRMSMHDRAAQFAPFAALVGYDDAVAETARLTESRPELDEQEQRVINERLAYIADHIHEQPEVRIKYFVPDEYKSGWTIIEVSGKVKKISATDGTIVMADGRKIRLSDITDLSFQAILLFVNFDCFIFFQL